MRLIKKLRSRGGYAMVYVVVAMTLMLAVVGGITATAARNLQTQQSAVSMMVDRYEAAGAVEAKFAEIAKIETAPIESTESEFDPESMLPLVFENLNYIIYYGDDVNRSFTAKIEGGSDNTTITAYILVRYTVTSTGGTESTPAADPPEDPKYTYTVTVTSVEYQSYNVEYKGAGT